MHHFVICRDVHYIKTSYEVDVDLCLTFRTAKLAHGQTALWTPYLLRNCLQHVVALTGITILHIQIFDAFNMDYRLTFLILARILSMI